MKANKFIKKFGWSGFLIACKQRPIDRYKYTIIWSDEVGFSDVINERDKKWTFESKEVKRLVESYKMTESVGGLEKSKLKVRLNSASLLETSDRFKQAIMDVDLCQ